MRPGHLFTIEPMINEGGYHRNNGKHSGLCSLSIDDNVGTWHYTQWPDNWTAVTADGKRSAQFEHTMLVTETGVEIL